LEPPFHAVHDAPPRAAGDRLRESLQRTAAFFRRAFRRTTVAWLLFLAPPVVSFVVLVSSGTGEAGPEGSPLHAVGVLAGTVLAALLGASLSLLYLAVTEIFRGEPLAMESHWGGFGGGLGGWRISSSLAYLLGALFLGGLFGTLVLTGLRSDIAKSWLGIPTSAPASGTADDSSPASGNQDEGARQGSSAGDSAADGEEDS